MNAYQASDITVLEGLEAVRKRPGMYIGGTGFEGLHHLLWEIVDNAMDEAMNGHASAITIRLHANGTTVTVQDNGRGIPVDVHPKKGVSALQVILTTLHAGGKFDGNSYKTAGGLHGVGASVVNALSRELTATVRRSGIEYQQRYRRGHPEGPVLNKGSSRGKPNGTTITFTPDPAIFDDLAFDPQTIYNELLVKSYLQRGLRIVFKDQVGGQTHELCHEGGLVDYAGAIMAQDSLQPIADAPFVLARDNPGEEWRFELVLQWTTSPTDHLLSYVNGIPTQDGGTHVQGYKDALVKAVRQFMDTHDLSPKGLSITAEDIREGTLGILSFYHANPQFQGQTKDRLNNPDARGFVDTALRPALEQWLHDNKTQGEAIARRATQAAKARIASRQAATSVRRKSATSGRLNLPGKLADCSSSDPGRTELFIVEGDSAGGSAKQGRDRRTQAILPLRGKVLNAEQATRKRVLANEELRNVVTALGCGVGEQTNIAKLRYGRVILLMDADTDGHHISTLLLTFFYRYLRPVLDAGLVYLAKPPLYRIHHGKETYWCVDDAARDRRLALLPARAKPEITRFKGLGEMPPKTLFETTLNPKKRQLLQITIPDAELANKTVSELMGSDAAPRYRYLIERAAEVDRLDI